MGSFHLELRGCDSERGERSDVMDTTWQVWVARERQSQLEGKYTWRMQLGLRWRVIGEGLGPQVLTDTHYSYVSRSVNSRNVSNKWLRFRNVPFFFVINNRIRNKTFLVRYENHK